MHLFAIPRSLNVERVTLALGYKKLPVEISLVDPKDRTQVRELSGQELVPVLVDDDKTIVFDSPVVLEHLERCYPDPPLWPADPARRAEMDVFVDWFNRLWKPAPNLIAAGRDPNTPAACIQSATTPEQRVTIATLATIAEAADRDGLVAPLVTVIGEVVALSGAVGQQGVLVELPLGLYTGGASPSDRKPHAAIARQGRRPGATPRLSRT